jgi:hypothetical protein
MDNLDTYGGRLASAMHEGGFGGPGGQSQLAKEIGVRSQTINQALSGGSKELSATHHVRVCLRLGVRPLWLSEGKGARYENPYQQSEPVAAVEIARVTENTPQVSAFEEVARDMALTGPEAALIEGLRRRSSGLLAAITQVVKATPPTGHPSGR